MTNPYHDPYSGQFCSKGEMTSLMNSALSSGDSTKYLTYREVMNTTAKARDEVMLAGFDAVTKNDAPALKKLIGGKLKKLADDSDEKVIVAGWLSAAKTAATVSALAESSEVQIHDVKKAFESLSDEEQVAFVRESPFLDSKSGYVTSELIEGDPRTRRTYDSMERTSRLVEATLERETLSHSAYEAAAKVAGGPQLAVIKIAKDYKEGKRKTWPFVNKDVEHRAFHRADSPTKGGVPRMLFAKRAQNPELLASIGASDSVALDEVLENPNTDAKALATILVKNNTMTSEQYSKTRALLATKSNLPPEVSKALKGGSQPTAAVYTDEERNAILKTMKQSSKMRSFHHKRVQGRDSSMELRITSKKAMEKEEVAFEDARAKLDATAQNYEALIKQRDYLKKSASASTFNEAYKTVAKRIEKADGYRVQTAGADDLKNALKPHIYHVTELRKNPWA